MEQKWIGLTNQQAKILNSTYMSNSDVQNSANSLKSNRNQRIVTFSRKFTEKWSETWHLK